jgi:hypothetical protein
MPADPPNETAALAAVLGRTTEANSLTITKKGTEYTITAEPLTIDQISRIMLCIDRLAARGVLAIDSSLLDAGKPTIPNAPKFSYSALALRGGKDAQEMLAIAANTTAEIIGSLNILEFCQVAGLLYQVQKDFFARNQIEILKAFGLDESAIDEIKKLYGSMKSLLNSLPAASPTSAASPSDKSTESAPPLPANSETPSPASPPA